MAFGFYQTSSGAPSNAARTQEVKKVHHPQDGAGPSGCIACHTDGAAMTASVEQSCKVCHEKGAPAVVDAADKNALPAASGAMGMVGEQYNETSRFGSAPGAMIRIPAGEFTVGTNERFSDEGPQHKVRLDDFYIDRFEVTNLQYQAFIEQAHRRAPAHFVERKAPAGKADHPVVQVSWFDARDYCEWAGKRLPTEQEWEKAARGTDGRTYPWGESFDVTRANTPVRWQALGVKGDTAPVGAFPSGASPYGLEDMSGNVWEWTSSWYRAYPGNQHESENYGEIYKVLKGGSWWDCSFYKCGISAPVYNRSFFNARVKNDTFGFRCAKDGK
ncbi:MAG: SUMF1/EgtB/PvdO family nonheme iron enzyme [Chromatiales bacterium]|nr:SUMF1/EgtB/PvdO family nonheme iron enzyme [Chromatiales bacterium]